MYSGEDITPKDLIDDSVLEVDHIIHISLSGDDSLNNKVLVFSSENQNKGARTPYEYFGDDVEKLRYLIEIDNGLRVTTGVNKAYSLEFVPNDESFFSDGAAVKSGMTTGKIKMLDGEDLNTNSMTKNSITVNIQVGQTGDANPDDINPDIEYSLSETDWTNKSVNISVIATDNVGIKEVVLPDGSIVTDSNIEYIADSNGVYTFKAIDVNGNESVINVPINNIDKDAPSLIVEYDRDTLLEQITLNIKGIDTLSGVREIILPDKTIINGSETNYTIIENGIYELSVVDNAGNTANTSIEINNIVYDNSIPDVTPPDVIPPTDIPSEIIPPIDEEEEDIEIPIETPEDNEENNGDSDNNEENNDNALDLEDKPDTPVENDSNINNKPINSKPDNKPDNSTSEVDKSNSIVDDSDLKSEINHSEEQLDNIDNEINYSEDNKEDLSGVDNKFNYSEDDEYIADANINQYDDSNVDMRTVFVSTISIGAVAAYIQYLKKRRK